MPSVLKISSPDELIAFVPHALGFTPQGMVCLPLGGGPTARLDIPRSPNEMDRFLRSLSDVYLRQHHPRQVALLAYGQDGRSCEHALAALGEALAGSEGPGPNVGPMLWVNGDQWMDVLTGEHGIVHPSAHARMAAEFALLGRAMPVARRGDLAAALQGDATEVARLMPAAEARLSAMDLAGSQEEATWVGARIDQFGRDRLYLSDDDAARLLTAIRDGAARDAAENRMSRHHAPVQVEFWHDLVRRAPAEVRDTPAAMLALSCYLYGQGAQAWVAIDQVATSHPLAELVKMALERAIHPRDLEQALRADAPGALMQQNALRRDGLMHRRAQDPPAGPSTNARPASPDPGR